MSLFILFIVGLFAIGINGLGFYSDDWITMSNIHFSDGLGIIGLATKDPAQFSRPLCLILWPIMYGLFGQNPIPYHILLVIVNVLLSYSLLKILRKWGVSEYSALLSSILLLLWPSKDSNLYWPFNVMNPLSCLLSLEAYRSHCIYAQYGDRNRMILSSILIALSLMLYDQSVAIPILFLIVPAGYSSRAKDGFILSATIVAMCVLYKYSHSGKPIILSMQNVSSVYFKGLLTNFGPDMVMAIIEPVVRSVYNLPIQTFLAVFSMSILCYLKPILNPEPYKKEWLIVLGIGFFIVGYIPIAFSNYIPSPFTHTNRINLLPSVGIAIVMAATWTNTNRATRILLPILVSCQIGVSDFWRESYTKQLRIRNTVLSNKSDILDGKDVYIGHSYVGKKAPVFVAYWEIMGAVRMWTGKSDAMAYIK